MHLHTDTWRLGQIHRPRPARDLEPGQIAVIGRTAYRIVQVHEIDQVDWREEDRDRWQRAGQPAPHTWPARPLVFAARPDALPETVPDARHEHFTVDGDTLIPTLAEHYLVCRACGELPPCRHSELEDTITREQQRMTWLFGILPDCCHGCRTPVTARQRAILFPGPNLWRPDLGHDSALFHLRATCRSQAMRYDEQWAAAVPGRRRMLYCPGRLTLHHGGDLDCTEGTDCPGAEVHHVARDWHHPSAGSPQGAGCWCLASETDTEGSAPRSTHGGNAR